MAKVIGIDRGTTNEAALQRAGAAVYGAASGASGSGGQAGSQRQGPEGPVEGEFREV